MNFMGFCARLCACLLGAVLCCNWFSIAQLQAPEKPKANYTGERESWRPAKADVDRADDALAELARGQAALLNALRVVSNTTENLPDELKPQGVEPLGKAVVFSDDQLEAFSALRLAAVIRAGYPLDSALESDLLASISPANPKSNSRFTQALAELCLADAVLARGPGPFESWAKRAAQRARRVVSALEWSKSAPRSAPDAAMLVSLAAEAMCRELALRHGWGEKLPKGVRGAMDDLAKRLVTGKGGLWPELLGSSARDKTEPAPELKLRLMALLGAIFSSALRDLEWSTEKEWPSKPLTAAVDRLRGLLDDFCSVAAHAALLGGEAAALLAGFHDTLLPERLKPRENLATRALAYFDRSKPDAAPPCVDLAEALNWAIALQTGAPKPQPNAPGGGKAPPKAATPATPVAAPDRLHVAKFALALLGACGGIVSTPGASINALDGEEIRRVGSSLAVMALHTAPGLADRAAVTIDRAAAWMLANQKADGTFPGGYGHHAGGHALCILALLEAGISRDHPAMVKAVAALDRMPVNGAADIFDAPVYTYSIALMAYQKLHEKEQLEANVLKAKTPEEFSQATGAVWKALKPARQKTIRQMVETLTRGPLGLGWDYTTPGEGDNSNSQFAVLGLRAASLLGAKFDRKIFAAEATRLVKHYLPDPEHKSIIVELEDPAPEVVDKKGKKDTKPEVASNKIVPGSWGYNSIPSIDVKTGEPCCHRVLSLTAAGVSSLVICRDELILHGMLTDVERYRIDVTIGGALHWLGTAIVKADRVYMLMSGSKLEGFGRWYDLYSIERAGVLADVRYMGDLDWYARGAKFLIDSQRADGSWKELTERAPAGDRYAIRMVDHCFAVLFLKRAVVPVVNKPVILTGHERAEKARARASKPATADEPRSPVTGGSKDTSKPEKE